MRRGLPTYLLFFGVSALACTSKAPDLKTPDGPGPQIISPQPQPNQKDQRITAPCNAARCGAAPSMLSAPHCAPRGGACTWDEDAPVSFRGCEEAMCGEAPGPETCPTGTTFKGNDCGSENDAACAWSTACVTPRSTTPCSRGDSGCGGKPELAVICQDGRPGDLACMLVGVSCRWERTCD